MTRYVIHNHLPDAKTRDSSPNLTPATAATLYAKIAEWEREMERARAGGFLRAYETYRRTIEVAEQDLARFERSKAKDAKNLAYDIKVRRMTSGADFNIRLFAPSQEQAEERAKERARSMEKIPPDKYREYLSKGHAVFRIVSSKVSENQKSYSEGGGLDAVGAVAARVQQLKKELRDLQAKGAKIPMLRNEAREAELRKTIAELERKGSDASAAHDVEAPYHSIVMRGWMFRKGGTSYGPFPDEAAAQRKMESIGLE